MFLIFDDDDGDGDDAVVVAAVAGTPEDGHDGMIAAALLAFAQEGELVIESRDPWRDLPGEASETEDGVVIESGLGDSIGETSRVLAELSRSELDVVGSVARAQYSSSRAFAAASEAVNGAWNEPSSRLS